MVILTDLRHGCRMSVAPDFLIVLVSLARQNALHKRKAVLRAFGHAYATQQTLLRGKLFLFFDGIPKAPQLLSQQEILPMRIRHKLRLVEFKLSCFIHISFVHRHPCDIT